MQRVKSIVGFNIGKHTEKLNSKTMTQNAHENNSVKKAGKKQTGTKYSSPSEKRSRKFLRFRFLIFLPFFEQTKNNGFHLRGSVGFGEILF